LAIAEKILDQASELDQVMQSYKGHLVGRINISIVSTGKYVMPYLLTDFLKEHPAVEFEIDVTNKERVDGKFGSKFYRLRFSVTCTGTSQNAKHSDIEE